MPGAEPYSAAGGRAGVLLLHGFTGSPFSMRRTAERLAARGFSVEAPLLPGHGTAVEDLLACGWDDWSAAADAALEDLAGHCSAVAVVGHSMGGTLACWLAERHGSIVGLAIVNPLVRPPDDGLRAAARELLESGTEVWKGDPPDTADPSVVFPTYDGAPLAPFLSLCEGAAQVAPALGRIRCPVLLVSSRVDHVVPPADGDFLAAAVSGTCERVWLDRSYHNAMVDFDHEEVETRIEEFCVSVTSDAGGEET